MSTIHRSRTAFLGIAAVLAVALVAPVAAQTEDQPIAAAPAAPSWDETSGYGVVEANRAVIGHDDVVSGYAATGHEASAAMGLFWDETSGYGSVEANRAAAPEAALSASWDESSGYGSVEASRAANALPVAASQVPNPDSIPAALASGRRVESAHLATVPLPGEASNVIDAVAGAMVWDETSGYGAVEASRTDR